MAIVNCLNLNNFIDISNDSYVINGNNVLNNSNILFGIFTTTPLKKYIINNIPKDYPIGFYNNSSPASSITDMIVYDVSYNNPIIIYVSNGNDLSYNNGDFFRFYDESFNLININKIITDLQITTSGENFYFMRNMEYLFIATEDFSSNHPFCISGNLLALNSINYNDVSLHQINDSFVFKMPSEANNYNQSNIIYYTNPERVDEISGNFNILVDSDNISYFYNKISIEVPSTYSTNYSSEYISFKSFVINNNQPIVHTNKLCYSESCGYIIAELSEFVTLLADNNTECLNKVSKATLRTLLNGDVFYELNTGNHGISISYEDLYDISYGIYDGSYVLFNINENYPITLLNNDISNNIYIEETYSRTKIIHKSDSRIINLTPPLNTYNYYHGAIRIFIDNSDNGITGLPIKFQMYDLNLLNNYELSFNFIYTSFCIDPDNVNSIGNDVPIFSLYNKFSKLYDQSLFDVGNNVFDLNLYELFVEPNPPYKATDRYNHDISNLVSSNAPLTTNDINYDLNTFIITYNLIDYEDNITQINRIVRIYRGPFIEIINNDIFDSSNQYTDLIYLSPEKFSQNYNFYKDINVYLYDVNKNRIDLPFEIILTGTFYTSNSIFSNLLSENILGDKQNIINYNVVDNNNPLFIFDNNNIANSLKYYLTKNLQFTYKQNEFFTVTETGIEINNISYIQFNNLSSNILDQLNIIYINGITAESYNDFFAFNNNNNSIHTINLDADTDKLLINKINNNLSQIDISQSYEDLSLNTSLIITNEFFKIEFIDISDENNNLTIDGCFNAIDFYNRSNHIDISNIGSYSLNIIPKGLNTTDFILNDISDIIIINDLNINYNRTVRLHVTDNIAPTISFFNGFIHDNSYQYIFSRSSVFNILNNITFYKNTNQVVADDYTPLIYYDDNTIYNGDLRFSIKYTDGNTGFNGTDISVNDSNIDGSAIIVYNAFDISGNLSNDISLTIFFRDVPDLQLIDDNLVVVNIFEPYIEAGIILNNNNSLIYIPVPLSTYEISTMGNAQISDGDTYDIAWSTNINTNLLGTYFFRYSVKNQSVPYSVTTQRIIIVRDTVKPAFEFPNLNLITKGYIDASSGLNNDSSYNLHKTPLILHSEDTSFNIDFSLTVFSSFDDLSSIIYNFDVCDNYLNAIDKNNNVTIKLEIGNKEIPFTFENLRNINYVNDNSNLSIITIGENVVDNLKFTYEVNDNTNTYSVERIVDIIDVAIPTIEFSFNPVHRDFLYVLFNNNDFKDFSYQAFDVNKDEDLFYAELNSIIFDFTLKDNYEISNNHYSISIIDGVNIDDNILDISNISLNSIALFSQINKEFDIVYDICDNQFNTTSVTRKVQIISTINPEIVFNSVEPLIINFGDIDYDIKSKFTLSHPRFLNADINIDLSYIIPLPYTTFSGDTLYDTSAIINPDLITNTFEVYDISFYSVLTQTSGNLSSDILNINIQVINNGPIFETIDNNISFESGVYIPDASLIFGVIPVSDYDKFYYFNFLPDISYIFTIFDISYSNLLDQNNPQIGTYLIEYSATDKNNLETILTRTITIIDTLSPDIELNSTFLDVSQSETLIIPSAIFNDIGSGINNITIDLSNSSNNNTTSRVLTLNNLNLNFYDFSSTDLLLTQIDTSNSLINYTVTYTVIDNQNNSSSKGIQIRILQDTTYVLKLFMKFYDTIIELNNNFDSCFNTIVNTSSTNFKSGNIKYNILDNVITYEASSLNDFSNISFDMSAIYNGNAISDDNNNILYNIVPNQIGNYEIFFQSFNDITFESETQIVVFKVIDTTPPKLTFLTNPFFQDICNIELPLLSPLTIESLNNNINFLLDNNYQNINIFNKVNDVIIYSIPGININDIVNGNTITLSNELINPDFSDVFTVNISYNIANTNTFIDNNSMLLNSNIYTQNYRVFDNVGNQVDISRNIEVKQFIPFINLNYSRNANGYEFLKTYHRRYSVYKDLLGTIYDYFNGIVSDNRVIIDKNIDESQIGIQQIVLKLENNVLGNNPSVSRNVHVINIDCMSKDMNFTSLISNDINTKNGIFDGSYNIQVDISDNAFRIYGYDYDQNVIVDVSNLILVNGEHVIDYSNNLYYWGLVNVDVIGDFNRASIEYLNNKNPTILEDALIYTSECENKLIFDEFNSVPLSETYIVDISGLNQSRDDNIVRFPFFTIRNINAHINDISNQPVLHLPIGKYRFIHSGFKNFYNKIRFSVTPDGIHNNGVEYIKDVRTFNLAGLNNSYTDILITANTPTPLYYYSDNTPSMGSYISIKNNIIISNGNIYISDNVLSVENKSVLANAFGRDQLINKIVICHKFNLINNTDNNDVKLGQNFVCITHQNINHNIGFDYGKNKIYFKKYQHTPAFDPVTQLALSYPVPTYPSGPQVDLSNNVKHDVSNNFLFDVSVNNSYSNLFFFNVKEDTSENLISDIEPNLLKNEYIVAVGGTVNTVLFSSNNRDLWFNVDNSILPTYANSVDYNGIRWIAVGEGTDKIAFSDNGFEWFNLKDSSNIFSVKGNYVYWNNVLSVWYILGEGTNTLAYSENGIIWNGLGDIFTTAGYGIYFYNNLYVAVGQGNDTIKYSTDGLTWIGVNNSSSIFTTGYSVKWISSLSVWIAVGTGAHTIATSNDGMSWTGLSNSLTLFSIAGYDVDFDGVYIVLCGEGINTIITTIDITNWNLFGNSVFSVRCNGISWSGTRWYAVGEGANSIVTSTNVSVWTPINNSNNLLNIGRGIKAYNSVVRLNNDPSTIKYEINTNDIYYLDNEINRYYNYFKRNRLLNTYIYPNSFLNKINEIVYENRVDIYNNNELYGYLDNEFMNSNRIIFSTIFENLITLNLQTYIDISSIEINNDLYNLLLINANNVTNTNYITNNNNLLFGEYVINILTDISGVFPLNFISPQQSIVFSNGTIELNEYLLDSVRSNNMIDVLYNSFIGINGINKYERDVENKIFLSIRDTNFINNKYIGITQQNIYHNIFIDDNKKFIFHKYDTSINSVFVNKNTTLVNTLHDLSNNKKYLLEISDNDIYNCFVDENNIYENAHLKNIQIPQGSLTYKSIITYLNSNELEVTNEFVENFNIEPITLNNISYELYPYAYDLNLQNIHTHTYYIDLNDFFNRIFYNNSRSIVPFNILNSEYISYNIIDISFVNDFNIYDIDSSVNILYDKSKIELLNYIQMYIVTTNFKLNFFTALIKYSIIYRNNVVNYNESDYNFLNNINFQNIHNLYENSNVITDNYVVSLDSQSLNELFTNNYSNTILLIDKFNKVIEMLNFYQDYGIINSSVNPYNNITNFTNVEQMETDINLINSGLDSIMQTFNFYYNETIIFKIFNHFEETTIIEYNNYNSLIYLTERYFYMRKMLERIIFEFNVRDLNNGLISSQTLISYSFTDLYNISDINLYIDLLKENYVVIDALLKQLITYSKVYILTSFGQNIPDSRFTIMSGDNITFTDLSNQAIYVIDNYDAFFQYTQSNYEFVEKIILFDRVNYVMSGSKLLINSYKSNNIIIKLNLNYNTYLYPNIALDTIVLDMLIPDKTPPTIIFSQNTTITLEQTFSTLTDNSINSIVEALIADISYIDIDQEFNNITLSNVNAEYNDFNTIFNSESADLLINNVYSLITIDVRNIYNPNNIQTGDEIQVEIYYNIRDNANNENTIPRTINVKQSLNSPIYFFNRQSLDVYLYNISPNRWSITLEEGSTITNEELLLGVTAIDPINNENITVSVSFTPINTNIPGTYEDTIIYSATSNSNGNTTTVKRDIIINEIANQPIVDKTVCCYPPAFYLPIQHRYKLGSHATNVMRLAKIILNYR